MTTPVGQIGLNDVNAELGYSPTALITMNDAAVRTLAGVGGSGTVISMNDLRGKSNRVTIPLSISSPVANYDVYSNRGPTYSAGKSDITLTIAAPAVVYSASTGSSALSVPSSFTSGDTITVVNNGVILGRGGAGGNGKGQSWPAGPGAIIPGSAGGTGGPALSVSFPASINNANRISGGGGGGGGGGMAQGVIRTDPDTERNALMGGGGGGGGIGNGSAGSGGPTSGQSYLYPGSAGGAGTLVSNGSGGTRGIQGPINVYNTQAGNGGAGGSYGSSGSSGSNGSNDVSGYAPQYQPGYGGGASGAAVSGNPYITWIATGTRNGPIS